MRRKAQQPTLSVSKRDSVNEPSRLPPLWPARNRKARRTSQGNYMNHSETANRNR
jgi:hypothetical protein